ncbi:pimeloyl-ACP methyl ester carboxylesterase [Actinoplanes digitatis]|uniref:Pimeloyl-ACP methyl ester carboxylesterase n=1 Tax=Actinoplanes digitatis TaxID=1868 RepID=A0A7W7HVR5_9ACTN|nr:pimeloyl-ACP methyl ester carboxylesterase [Actinoplanes digitatis]
MPDPSHEVKAADGRLLTASDAGPANGRPVFLLHGTPGSRTGPRPRASVLHRRGIRLISYDRPGYGRSDRHPDRRVGDAAADIAAIADSLGLKRFSVVGRSGGGPHALAAAALLPDRVHRVATLVGMAPNDPGVDWFSGMTSENVSEFAKASDSDLSAIQVRLLWKALRTAAEPRSLLDHLLPQMTTTDQLVLNDATIQALLVEAYKEAVRSGPYGWIDDVVAMRRDWGFKLDEIDVPVRLWHGADDNFAPAGHARWLAGQIPGAMLDLVSNSAHFSAIEVLPDMLTWLADGLAREPVPGGAERQPPGAQPSVRQWVDDPPLEPALADRGHQRVVLGTAEAVREALPDVLENGAVRALGPHLDERNVGEAAQRVRMNVP